MRLSGTTSGTGNSSGHNSEGCDDVIVDTTGAGDAYIGGFLYGVLHSMTLAVRICMFIRTRTILRSIYVYSYMYAMYVLYIHIV